MVKSGRVCFATTPVLANSRSGMSCDPRRTSEAKMGSVFAIPPTLLLQCRVCFVTPPTWKNRDRVRTCYQPKTGKVKIWFVLPRLREWESQDRFPLRPPQEQESQDRVCFAFPDNDNVKIGSVTRPPRNKKSRQGSSCDLLADTG